MRHTLAYILSLCLSGCAVHVPMSEVLVFRTPGSAFETTNTNVKGPAVTFTKAAPDSVWNSPGFSMAAHGTTYRDNNGTSFTAGAGALGIDVTQRIAGPVHVLASGSMLGGAEAFVLSRVPLPSRRVGLSLGAGSRCRYQLSRGEPLTEFVFEVRIESEWSCSVGARTTAAWIFGDASPGVLGTLYVGYAPRTEDLVVAIGLAGLPL